MSSGITNFQIGSTCDIYIDNHREIKFFSGATNQTTTGSTIHFTGETYGGGVVYVTWSGGTGGLIYMNGGTGRQKWCSYPISNPGTIVPFTFVAPLYNGGDDGNANTDVINAFDTGSTAASWSKTVTEGGYTDWYLPSKYEISLGLVSGGTSLWPLASGTTFNSKRYWSSNQSDHFGNSNAYRAAYAYQLYTWIDVNGQTQFEWSDLGPKTQTWDVLPIRRF